MPRSRTQHGRVLQLALALVLPPLAVAIGLLFVFVESTAWRWGLSLGLLGTSVLGAIALLQQSKNAFARIANGLSTARLGPDANPVDVLPNRELEHALSEIDRICNVLERQRLGADDARTIRRRLFAELQTPAFTFDEEGCLLEVNESGASVMGASPATLVGESAASLGMKNFVDDAQGRIALHLDGHDAERIVFQEGGRKLTLVFLSSQQTSSIPPRDRERGSWQRLFRVLVHEVNNSLTPIRAIAEALRLQLSEPLPEDWRSRFASSLETVGRRAQRLSQFVDAYGAIARLPKPEPGKIAVRAWLEDIARLESRVKVVVEAGPDAVLVADQSQLDQAVLNLLQNAADASLTTDGTITLSWQIHEESCEILIDDEGPGLEPDLDPFLPFVSTKSSGTGIGLALCREIVEAHGGSVDLFNRSGHRGCRARLALPLNAGASDDVAPSGDDRLESRTASDAAIQRGS